MKLAASQALYAHWSSLCRGRLSPDRHDLDPAVLRGVLAHTFMLEIVSTGSGVHEARTRLSGTRVNALFGRELKDAPFASLWASMDQSDARRILDTALDDVQPILVSGFATPRDCGEGVLFEMLLLPLRHNRRTHSRLLGSLVPAAVPNWIGLRPVDAVSLRGWRAIDRLAEAQWHQADEHSLETAVRRGHLVVHQGGRAEGPIRDRISQVRVKTGVRGLFRTSLSPRLNELPAQD